MPLPPGRGMSHIPPPQPPGDMDSDMHSLDEDGTEGEEYTAFGEEHYVEDEDYEPSEQEIVEYCEWLGMDLKTDRQLAWIAREALLAPLPEHWKICHTEDREVYYFNVRTGESIWDHPMDTHYKALFRQEKSKLEKKRVKMRLHAGSFPILPLQDFFSGLTESPEPEIEIPEHLLDPIDFRLFTDPVVLPTSGRTVSKHTIVNNKWRDPFSREYVENRTLIPNVDKKNEVINWMMSAIQNYMKEKVCNGTALAPLISLMPYILDQECEVSLCGQNIAAEYLRKLFVAFDSGEATSPGSTSGSTSARRQSRKPKTTPRNQRVAANTASPTPDEPISAPSPASNSSAISRDQGPRSDPNLRSFHSSFEEGPVPQPPPPQPDFVDSVGYRELSQLDETSLNTLLGGLLTMATSTAQETLLLILDAVPTLRSHRVFKGFSTEVLNVLHLSEKDLISIAVPRGHPQDQSIPLETDRTTTNDDHLISLKWILLLVDRPVMHNVLEKLDWRAGLQIVFLVANSLPGFNERTSQICRLVRSIDGWPEVGKMFDSNIRNWLMNLALQDPSPWNQMQLMSDILTNSVDGGLEALKNGPERTALLKALQCPTVVDSSEGLGKAASIGSLLIFNDCCKLSDFEASSPLLASVAHSLLPRLTRQQWRPRHFESTVHSLTEQLERSEALSNRLVTSNTREIGQPVAFLLDQLSKKKRLNEGLRERLNSIESAEKDSRRKQAAVNWRLATLRMEIQALQVAERAQPKELLRERIEVAEALASKLEKRRGQIVSERAGCVTQALLNLLHVRIKSKRDKAPGAVPSEGSSLGKIATKHSQSGEFSECKGQPGPSIDPGAPPLNSQNPSAPRRRRANGKNASHPEDLGHSPIGPGHSPRDYTEPTPSGLSSQHTTLARIGRNCVSAVTRNDLTMEVSAHSLPPLA